MKMASYLKLVYRLRAFPIKTGHVLWDRGFKADSKICVEMQGGKTQQDNLKRQLGRGVMLLIPRPGDTVFTKTALLLTHGQRQPTTKQES